MDLILFIVMVVPVEVREQLYGSIHLYISFGIKLCKDFHPLSCPLDTFVPFSRVYCCLLLSGDMVLQISWYFLHSLTFSYCFEVSAQRKCLMAWVRTGEHDVK